MAERNHPLSSEARRARRSIDPSTRLLRMASCQDAQALALGIRDGSPEVARAAIWRLVEVDPTRASDVLRNALLDAEIALVQDIAKALKALHDPKTTQLAVDALNEEPYTRRMSAAITLGIMGDTTVAGALRGALHDPIAAVRQRSLEGLARLDPDPQTMAEATALLRDPNAQVRIAAIRLLTRDHQHSEPDLAHIVDDPDAEVRGELARHPAALGRLDVSRLLTDTDEGVRCQAARSAGADQVQGLGDMLRSDPRAEARRAAARRLGAIGSRQAANMLLDGIADQDAMVRASALDALVQALTRTGAIARLLDELHSKHAQRRRFSLYALAQLAPGDHATTVWALADDPDLDVRFAMIETAHALVSEPQPLLIYMGTDPDPAVRASAGKHASRVASGSR